MLTSVALKVDDVNMVRREVARAYHHGDLRNALIDAGVALSRVGGPGAVVIRAVSREAGVSHNAAYRHFANQEDLVAAVAERCMQALSELMTERMARVTVRNPARRAEARIEAIGRAYVDFARTEPGWFRTAFSAARPHDAASGTTVASPLDVLRGALDDMVTAGALSPAQRVDAEYGAWSAVHGVSSLLLDGPLRELPESEAERVIDAVLGTERRRLT